MNGLRIQADLATIDEEDKLPPTLPPPSKSQPVETIDPQFARLDPLYFFDAHEMVKTSRGEFSVYTGGTLRDIAYVFIHGAGYSALSFAEVVKYLKQEAFCLAIDLRGHGSSCSGEPYFQVFVDDVNAVIDYFFESQIPAVLFGHSLGGSIITAIASPKIKVEATVLIDISEIVALQSLPNMQAFLSKKPRHYSNDGQMAQWLFYSHYLLRKIPCRIQAQGMVAEDGRLISDLTGTEKYWEGWFSGMNERFLRDEKIWKMLLVSTMGKLDKDFEIAHMRGKMNVDVVRNSVHNLHEDNPVAFLGIVTRFTRRLHLNDRLYKMPFDFKRPLLDEEKEVPEDQLREFFPE